MKNKINLDRMTNRILMIVIGTLMINTIIYTICFIQTMTLDMILFYCAVIAIDVYILIDITKRESNK